MKKIHKIFGIIIATFMLSSCEKFLDVNTDPTLKSDVTMQELLSTALFYTSENSYNQAYIACQYIQQIGSATGSGGTDAQAESENGTGWTNLYLNVIPHLNIIIEKSKAENSPAYEGISKVLMAYNLGIATTSWENVPYNEADKKNFAPQYDSQESIYTTMQKLLDEAIISLANNSGAKPSTDDIIYNGDLAKWTRLAYTLKARYSLHLSKKNAVKAATDALANITKGFLNNNDDFQLVYNSRNLGPWYSRVALANSTGNLSVTHGASLIAMMNTSKDPRLPLIATLGRNQTVYTGATTGRGTGSTVSFTITNWHSRLVAPIQMVTYSEAKAIESEARFILNGGNKTSTGSTQQVYDLYLDIARTNMAKMGVTDANITAYLTNPVVAVTPARLKIENIITEKNKSMFLIGDIWTDYRRYDYMGLNLPEQQVHNVELKGQWIQRMRYPISESTRNSNVAKANYREPFTTMWMFQ
jgi:hypothetical protein